MVAHSLEKWQKGALVAQLGCLETAVMAILVFALPPKVVDWSWVGMSLNISSKEKHSRKGCGSGTDCVLYLIV